MLPTETTTGTLFAAVLENFPSGVVVCDTQWRMVWMNRKIMEMTGLSPDAVLGSHICLLPSVLETLVQPDDRMRQQLVRITCNPEAASKAVFEWHRQEFRYIEQITTPVYSPEGSPIGYVCSLSDVTQAKEVDEMKNEFISVASHELRTPMTSIKGSLDLLLGGYAGPITDSVRELLEIGQAAVDRLIRLINDILGISKIEAGKTQLNLELLEPGELIRRTVNGLRAYAQGASVQLVISPSAPVPPVLADRDRMEQVLTNLLSNAIKYAPTGTSVEAAVSEIDGRVRFSVRDHGRGIPPDKLNLVFDKFQQLEGAKKGTGLGLAICRALVVEHGGDIWVRSEPDQGACFEFELPAAEPPAS